MTENGVLAPEELARYADAMVKTCVGIKRGHLLFVHGHPAHRELTIALAEAGYRAGARYVDVVYGDPRSTAARVRYGRDDALGFVAPWVEKRLRAQVSPDAGYVAITGEADPGVFDGLPPERIARDQAVAGKKLSWHTKAALSGRVRWAGGAWPTEYWAGQVYPDDEPLEARRRLGRDLLWFCRLTDEDGPGASGWERHVKAIAARARALTRLKLERLELRGPGTELDVKLMPATLWAGGREKNQYGQFTSPNIPTEECFTSPDPRSTEGTFRCSLPLSFAGRLIEGLEGEFRGGRLVRLGAAKEDDRDFLAAFLDSDPNGNRLGEVALVDRTSRIGQKGRTYFNTLIDENAAAHIAFGAGFIFTRGEGGKGSVNRSNIHIDVMIGSDEYEATGIAARGRRVPLIAGGSWQIEG